MPKKTENNFDIANRLRTLMARLGLNQVKLARMMDTSSAYVNNMLKEGKQPGSTILTSFKKNLPELNMNWLLTGEGDMFCNIGKETGKIENNEQQDITPTTNTREPAHHYHTEQASAKQHDISMLIEITDRQSKTIDKLTDLLQNATKPPCHDHENKTPPTKAPPGKNPGVVRLHRKKSRNL